MTLLDGNDVTVDKGSVSTDLSATTWAGQTSPSQVEWTLLGSGDGRGVSYERAKTERREQSEHKWVRFHGKSQGQGEV